MVFKINKQKTTPLVTSDKVTKSPVVGPENVSVKADFILSNSFLMILLRICTVSSKYIRVVFF